MTRRIVDRAGAVIYSGTSNEDIRVCLRSQGPQDITHIVIQILQNFPSTEVISLLEAVIHEFWSRSDVNVTPSSLYSLPHANAPSMCGRVLKKGDIIWTCQQCGKDATCVQCNECFQHSNHEGHEVYFHKSSEGGGCCDCGDPEAWDCNGVCSLHAARQSTELVDPLSILPASLHSILSALLKGVVQEFTDVLIKHVSGFGVTSPLTFQGTDNLIGVLYNDDIHTYDDVTSGLMACNMSASAARNNTELVDKQGHAVITQGNKEQMLHSWEILRVRGNLMYCVTPLHVHESLAKLNVILEWLLQLGNASDSLMRLVTLEVFAAIPDFLSVLPLLHTTPATTLPISPADVPRYFFSVLFACAGYLPAKTQRLINEFIVVYQKDNIFKPGFSQILMLTYFTVARLYCDGVGTSKETLFSTSVQVFTADSIVATLTHTTGRVFPEESPVRICRVLLETLLMAIQKAGKTTTPGSDEFLSHFIIRNRRVWHICRDLEHIFGCKQEALRFFMNGDDDSDLGFMCKILALLDGVDSRTRIPRGQSHVEYEKDWKAAMMLLLEVDTIICTALDTLFYNCPLSLDAQNTIMTNIISMVARYNEMPGECPDVISHSVGRKRTLQEASSNLSFQWSSKFYMNHEPYRASLHRPLHRLLSAAVSRACKCGWRYDWSGINSNILLPTIACAAQKAIRVASYMCQINAAMWRRNGYALENIAYNYYRVPPGFTYRENDICMIQYAALYIPHDVLLRNLVIAFTNNVRTHDASEITMMSELLRLLIQVIEFLPADFTDGQEVSTVGEIPISPEHIHGMVKQAVVHFVLSKNSTINQLSRIKHILTEGVVTDDVLTAAVDLTCTKRVTSDAIQLEVKPSEISCFDPEFVYLSPQEMNNAIEKVTAIKNERRSISFDPIVQKSAIVKPHSMFANVRQLLYQPVLFRLVADEVTVMVDLQASEATGSKKDCVAVICRAVHLLTLMYFFHGEFNQRNQLVNDLLSKHKDKSLLELLCQIAAKGLLQTDVLYQNGLMWLLQQFSAMDTSLDSVISTYALFSIDTKKDVDSDMKRRQEQAKQKALQRMAQQAKKFSADISDHESDEETATETAPECVLCLEVHDGSPGCDMGVFAHVCPSAIFAIDEEKEARSTSAKYRIVAKTVKLFADPPAEHRNGQVIGVLHKGAMVEVVSRREKWLQCERGWFELYSERELHAVDISKEKYAMHGRGGMHVSSCGHFIHLKCLNTYVASSMRRNSSGFSPEQGEMICPLCKFLANSFLPYDYHHGTTVAVPQLDTAQTLRYLAAPTITLPAIQERRLSAELSIAYIFLTVECSPTKEYFERFAMFAAELNCIWSATATTIKVQRLRLASGGALSKPDALVIQLMKDVSVKLRSFYENRSRRSFQDDIIEPLTALLFPRDREMHPMGYLMCPLLPLAVPPYKSTMEFLNATAAQHVKKRHPMLLYPLLMQDLHMLAVGLCDSECLVLLAFARLVQLLGANKYYTISSDWDCLCEVNSVIRQHASPLGCGNANVVQQWQEYVCFLYLLRNSDNTKIEDIDVAAVWNMVFPQCQLLAVLTSPQLLDLVKLWCEDYSKYCSSEAFVDDEASEAKEDRMNEPEVLSPQSAPVVQPITADDLNEVDARRFLEFMQAAMRDFPDEFGEEIDMEGQEELLGENEDIENEDGDEDWDNMQDGVGAEEIHLDGFDGIVSEVGRQDCVFPWKLQGVDPKCDILVPYYSVKQSQLFLQQGWRIHIPKMRNLCSLIELPKSYTDLYQQVKYPAYLGGCVAVEDPAICLLCGHVVAAGHRNTSTASELAPGECTLHARECNYGVGIFYLAEQYRIVLLHNKRAAWSPSIYLDVNGEISHTSGHNKPLFLSEAKYKALETMFLQHRIPQEIVRIRLGIMSVIRPNWY